jgi:hypothetical protein
VPIVLSPAGPLLTAAVIVAGVITAAVMGVNSSSDGHNSRHGGSAATGNGGGNNGGQVVVLAPAAVALAPGSLTWVGLVATDETPEMWAGNGRSWGRERRHPLPDEIGIGTQGC